MPQSTPRTLTVSILNAVGDAVPATVHLANGTASFVVDGKEVVKALPLAQLQPALNIGSGMKTLSLGNGAEDFPYAITADEAEKIISAAR
ncbi:hypothetical protein [Oecophyllibacter saccharovorans]|uniref:Uncharacterized protein n=1 Tax=Oecophyllibacter saccharovorans TaxID=2558360 RepID=A0A506URQ7_9PROT|nr:hypothetical protein [Oecophyllibacter saccharovorans]TPW36036.1 hypothetical protein E3202_03815 [Oecophyllibacter saccharovorans]